MKNIPLFTTASGAASIILEQIHINQTAYIRIQCSAAPMQLLGECLDFCRAVGASTVYATGEGLADEFCISFSVIRMAGNRKVLPKTETSLQTVDSQNIEEFRSIYNRGMRNIPIASSMTIEGAKKVIADGNGYFVKQNEELIGIGIADTDWIRAIVSVKKGAGETVLLALNEVLEGNEIHVELIDSNLPAKRLYERMGFQIIETVSTWYKII